MSFLRTYTRKIIAFAEFSAKTVDSKMTASIPEHCENWQILCNCWGIWRCRLLCIFHFNWGKPISPSDHPSESCDQHSISAPQQQRLNSGNKKLVQSFSAVDRSTLEFTPTLRSEADQISSFRVFRRNEPWQLAGLFHNRLESISHSLYIRWSTCPEIHFFCICGKSLRFETPLMFRFPIASGCESWDIDLPTMKIEASNASKHELSLYVVLKKRMEDCKLIEASIS